MNKAEFCERDSCITCESKSLRVLDKGFFGDEPHRSMFLNSPWGESPLPYLEKCEYILVECENCRQVFHKRFLNPEWQERRFNDWMTSNAIHRFAEMHGLNSPTAIFDKSRTIIDHLLCLERLTRSLRKPNERLRILDFGCGWGEFIKIGETLGFETYGIDVHEPRRFANEKRKVFTSFEDFNSEIKKPMHAITLFQVLEHLEEPKKTLQKAYEHLVPSGILILEVPNCSKITEIKTQDDLIIDGIDHINAFTPKTLTKIAELSGFTQIRQPIAQVSVDYKRIIQREIKRYLRYFLGSSTHQYFKRL